jgi:hypothetical protein
VGSLEASQDTVKEGSPNPPGRPERIPALDDEAPGSKGLPEPLRGQRRWAGLSGIGQGFPRSRLAPGRGLNFDLRPMFSHVVIFWTKSEVADATEQLLQGAEKYLRPIPGVLSFHVGKMSPSARPVVDQSYQVALNLIFPSKAAEQEYQVHPMHVEFVEKVFKPCCAKAVVYDFE